MKNPKYEVGAVLGLMMLAIWVSEICRPIAVAFGIAAILLIFYSWFKNKDTGKTLGLCPERIGPASQIFIFFFCLAITLFSLLLIGYFVDSENLADKTVWKKWENLAFGKYLLWGIIQ